LIYEFSERYLILFCFFQGSKSDKKILQEIKTEHVAHKQQRLEQKSAMARDSKACLNLFIVLEDIFADMLKDDRVFADVIWVEQAKWNFLAK